MTKKNNFLMLLSAVGLMGFTACADDKYDLSDIDMTIGVGSDEGFALPSSSTKLIKLGDMLELDDSKNVIINENNDYVFVLDGGEVADVTTEINQIAIVDEEKKSIDYRVEIPIPDLPIGAVWEDKTISIPAGEIDKELYTLRYEGDKPAEVVDLKNVGTRGSFNVDIEFSKDVQRFIPSFLTFQIEFPSYMKVKVSNWNSYTGEEKDDHTLQIKNVPTTKPLKVGVNIEALEFGEEGQDFLKINGETINMEGIVKVKVKWEAGEKTIHAGETFEKLELINHMKIEDCFITSATGKFDPEIDIQELGNATIGDLPDFLTNEDVVLDLDNPQITINLNSDLPVPGFLWGELTTTDKNGNATTDANGYPIVLNTGKIAIHGENNTIVICKKHEEPEDGVTNYVVRPTELSSIIENLSKIESFSFTAGARANPEVESKIDLSQTYTIKPSYKIEAPLALGERARIAYKDTLDGWNEDLQDLEFLDGAYLQVTADIENKIPANLSIDAYTIGVNGERVDDVTVEIDNTIIPAFTTTPFNISIKSKNALEKIDGIVFSFKVTAYVDEETHQVYTLNAENHGIKLENIKVALKGKVVIKDED